MSAKAEKTEGSQEGVCQWQEIIYVEGAPGEKIVHLTEINREVKWNEAQGAWDVEGRIIINWDLRTIAHVGDGYVPQTEFEDWFDPNMYGKWD